MTRKMLFLIGALLVGSFSLDAEEASLKLKRVYVDVVGDLPHLGHIEFYKKAKAEGDYLIVGVHSDEDVASYKRVPILTLRERVAMVEALRVVDEVIPAAPLKITEEWLNERHIDVVVHGDDFVANPVLLNEQYGAPIRMGIFKMVPYTQGISTTDIIQRIQRRALLEEKQAPST